jgi:hypothetical protein
MRYDELICDIQITAKFDFSRQNNQNKLKFNWLIDNTMFHEFTTV